MDRRACRRRDGQPKRRFPTLDAAQAHVGDPLSNAYRCPHCGQYHVGHLPGTPFGARPPMSKRRTRREARNAMRRGHITPAEQVMRGFACENCGAPVGAACTSTSGRTVTAHSSRFRQATAAGRLPVPEL